MDSIPVKFSDIQSRIAGRARLVAVSKTQPASKIQDVLDLGQRLFGENKVQEAAAHWDFLKTAYSDLELHLIGPLQTNKAKDAVRLFDCIHTLDRENLADALAREEKKQSKNLTYFIQVNTGREAQKAGVLEENLAGLIDYATGQNLKITGLMCIPPVAQDPAPHFERLKNLASRHSLPCLSMGMSEDFETAIAYGATHVRIGSALFGQR